LTDEKKFARKTPIILKMSEISMKIQIAGKNWWWWNNTREGFVHC
jgi:hypothetical protein